MTSRRIAGTLVIAASVLAAGGALAPAADAAVAGAPALCLSEDPYHYSSLAASTMPMVRTAYGDPGLTIKIEITAGLTVTATASGSVSGEVSVIVAHADVALGLSLAVSMTASVTYGATWTIPTSVHQGWLGAGAKANRMAWSHGHYAGCTWVIDRSGTMQAPYQLPYFWKGVS